MVIENNEEARHQQVQEYANCSRFNGDVIVNDRCGIVNSYAYRWLAYMSILPIIPFDG